MNPDTTSRRRKLIIVLVAICVVLIGFSVFYANKHSAGNKANQQTYLDPNSGETISNPAGKTPDTFGSNPNYPAFFGVSKLLEYGVTTDQLQSLEFYFYNFGQVSGKDVKEVSIKVDTVKFKIHDSNDPNSNDMLTFGVVIDRTNSYNATVELTGISKVRLVLIDKNNTVVYDSVKATGGDD